MRVVRAGLGALLLLVGLPLLLGGVVLWYAMQHQHPAGGYSAPLAPLTSTGHAVVASDVDALLRQGAPFARADQTTVRVNARTGTGPAFIGLAPATDVARYLAGVPYLRVEEVRLARGQLPVRSVEVAGLSAPSTAPYRQPFWLASSVSGALEWSPSELHGDQLALVVMHPDGQAPLAVEMTARVEPRWLASTTYGLLVLGSVLAAIGVAVLAWPTRPREIIYVVPPAQVPEVAAQLGIPVPRAALPPPVASAPPLDPLLAPAPATATSDAEPAPPPLLEWPPPRPS
jgi:hypothetical protein